MDITTKNYFELKTQGLKRIEIAEKFGLTDGQLKKLITKNGWAKIKPILNENSFKELNEGSAYWAGFIAADGNVDSKNRIRIMLNYDDTSHLEKFKAYLSATYTISSNTNKYYRSSLEFTSKVIRADLEKHFLIVPNKTSTLEFPAKLPLEILRHYIRGYFDGDGSVCESFSNANSKTSSLYATFVCGSKSFGQDLFEFLQIFVGLRGTLQDFENKIQIKFNTNDAKILLTWMYSNSSIYLDRKYNKYIDLVVNDNRTTR